MTLLFYLRVGARIRKKFQNIRSASLILKKQLAAEQKRTLRRDTSVLQSRAECVLRFVGAQHVHVAFTRHYVIQRVGTTYRPLFGGNAERDRERR